MHVIIQAWSAEEAKILLLLVRALNYAVGLQNFFVIFIVPLALMNNSGETIRPHGENIQLAVCSFSDSNKGTYIAFIIIYIHAYSS